MRMTLCCHSATFVSLFQNLTKGTLQGPTGLHQPSIGIRYLVFIITKSPSTCLMFKGLVVTNQTKYATATSMIACYQSFRVTHSFIYSFINSFIYSTMIHYHHFVKVNHSGLKPFLVFLFKVQYFLKGLLQCSSTFQCESELLLL